MSISKGLKKLQETVERAAEGQAAGDRPRTKWLSLKPGESVKIRFLQEADSDSPFYDEERGLIFIAREVSDPADYKKKCLDTLEDEGKSFGWEMHNKFKNTEGYTGGWKPKTRLYANILLVDDNEVAILSQGISGKSITPTLLEYAGDTGSITNKVFRIKRTGEGLSDTSYSLIMVGEDKEPFDFSGVELYDLEKVAVRHVPYAEQAAFFGYASEDGESSEGDSGFSTDTDW
jgi:hypothetical protein